MKQQASTETITEPDRFLRRAEVEAMTSMSTSRIYAAMGEGHFPRPRRIGAARNGAVAWLLSEVREWMATRPIADPQQAGRP